MNQAEGSGSWARNRNNTQGAPAGGVVRAGEAGRWYNSEAFRGGTRAVGRALTVYAAVQSGAAVVDAVGRDVRDGTKGEQTAQTVAEEAGGWAGAIALGEAGAALGALTGPAAPIAMPLLGLIGGGLGYFGGKKIVQGVLSLGRAAVDSAF